MDKSVASTAPYFDAGERPRADGLPRGAEGQAQDARPAVLDKLKQLLRELASRRPTACRRRQGPALPRRALRLPGELIASSYDYNRRQRLPATILRRRAHGHIATGGYGRGMLAPFFRRRSAVPAPYKQTPWARAWSSMCSTCSGTWG